MEIVIKQNKPVGSDFFPGQQAQAVNDIGQAAADCMARAIIQGILCAETSGDFTAFSDLEAIERADPTLG